MEKDDARKLKPEAQHERRKQVIRLHKRGIKRPQIVLDTGMSYSAVKRIIDLYQAEGIAALAPKARGRRAGDQRRLTLEQEQAIQKIICEKRPEQLRMKFALWSRQAVKQLVLLQLHHIPMLFSPTSRWSDQFLLALHIHK